MEYLKNQIIEQRKVKGSKNGVNRIHSFVKHQQNIILSKVVQEKINKMTSKKYNSKHICKPADVLIKVKLQKNNTSRISTRFRESGYPVIKYGEDDKTRIGRIKGTQNEIEDYDIHKEKKIQKIVLLKRLVEKKKEKHVELLNEKWDKLKCKQLKHKESNSNLKKSKWMSIDDSFMRAAALIREKVEENSISIEEKCFYWIQKWSEDWEKDLLLRPTNISETTKGRRAYNDFLTSVKSFQYLFNQLKTHTITKEVKNGIWLMVQAMKDRNYIHADAILLNAIAIGNAPWPIGVTQVGIHTKSAAREKISTSHQNKSAAAHIMGDEATRKYLHGLKRLLTAVQRLYPTNPSQSVEFYGETNVFKGKYGLGSNKLALIDAEQKGDIVMPSSTRSLLKYDLDGSIRVPDRLSQILKLD